MPPIPQLAPISTKKEETNIPRMAAANEDFFGRDACIETLNEEEVLSLFKKRKAVEWMVHNRTDAKNQEIYKNEKVRIQQEMKRYNLSEGDYENFLKDEGVMID